MIWFAEMLAGRIGMFNPASMVFNEVIVPTLSPVISSIAIDQKGLVWFVENRGNKIGVFDPVSAVVNEYEIPTSKSLPASIAVDREGIAWFTESDRDANRIGRLDIADTLKVGKKQEGSGKDENSDRVSHIIMIVFIAVVSMTLLAMITRSIKRKGK